MRESRIEAYLVRRVKELGGEVRKVQWIGRTSAPDRVVMLPGFRFVTEENLGRKADAWVQKAQAAVADKSGFYGRTMWVELKATGGKATFPKDAHERAQLREHNRMRAMGQRVVVIDSFEGVEEILK